MRRPHRTSRLSKLAGALLLGGALAACGGGGSDAGAPEAAAPETDDRTAATDTGEIAPAPGDAAVPEAGTGTSPAPGTGTGTPETPVRGTLLASVPYRSWSQHEISELTTSGLDGRLLREVIGKPRCDVRLQAIEYQTIGGAGEPVNATGGIAIPSGTDPICQAPHALVAWAHGTSPSRDYTVLDSTEVFGGLALAALAAHGYTVVAPDYTGYAGSTLPYHPYLNGRAQAADLVDALRAAREALAALDEPPPSALFLTGYSQGGYVAMASHREIEERHADEFALAGSFPMSGPYALADTAQRMLSGVPMDGATRLVPLLVDSYQNSYGGVFEYPAEIFVPPYDRTAPGLFPGSIGSGGALEQGLLPEALLASQGSPFLIQPAWADSFLNDPANALRQQVALNDLRDWTPQAPMALCGGGRDPVVPFENAWLARDAFATRGVSVPVYDFNTGSTLPGQHHSTTYLIFRSLFLAPGNEDSYHVALAPFCTRLARDFFDRLAGR